MAVLQGIEILLIEDAADLAGLYRKVLESVGVIVHEVTTAKSGIVTAFEIFPHLIVCDLDLLGQGAFAFLAALKRAPGLLKIPVLAVCKASDKAAILRARAQGVSECMLKPFVTTTLLERVEKMIAERPMGRHVFPGRGRPGADLTVPMEIVKVGESGLTVEAPVVLGRETMVRLDSPLLEQLGCGGVLTRSATERIQALENGGFVNDINLVGVSPKVAKQIRAFLRAKIEDRGDS